MKKGILRVKLVNRLVAEDTDAEDGPNGGRLDSGAEGLVVINDMLLGEAANHPARLVGVAALRH